MELGEVVRRRRMVRRYNPDPVDPAALDRILDTAGRGPSAGWTQAVAFVCVTAAERRAAIAALCGEGRHVAAGRRPWLSTAPVHLVVCVRPEAYRRRYAEADKTGARGPDRWTTPYWWVDAGAALGLVLLAAVDEGLGAGVLDVADPAGLKAYLGIPDDVAVVVLVTLGHPAADDRPAGSAVRRRRRPLAEVVHRERW